MRNLGFARLAKWVFFFVLGVAIGVGVRRAVASGGATTRVDDAARVVLDRCIEAMGGAKRLEAITSREARGAVEIKGAGVRGTVWVRQHAGGKLASITELGTAGTIVRGTDGTHAWEIAPGSPPRLLDGPERTERIERSKRLFIVPLGAAPDIVSITHSGTERVDTEEFDRLEVTTIGGAARFWLFSKMSGHLVHEDSTEKGPAGSVRVRLTHTEFRVVDGVTSPMGAVQDSGGMQVIFTTDPASLKYNNAIDDAAFTPPQEIQKMIDASK
ncbi:MAG TPA: hypothetical protein VF777_00955 [Phycisphaerales bacterium]